MAKFFLLAVLVNLAAIASAAPLVPRAGTQFITGPCVSDADCASTCCSAVRGTCAALLVANEAGGGGCGGKGAVATAPPAAAAAAAPAAGSSGKAPGTQFITGPCANDKECASGCCGFNTGKCAAAIVALERDGGCGRGDAQPNNNAAVALVGPNAPPAPKAPAAAAPPAAAPPAAAAPPPPPAAAPPAAGGSGKPPGTQFITGKCANDGECASGCCSASKGTCAAPLVAKETGGCGFGGATSPAAAAPVAAAAAAAPPAAAGSGKPPGTQFITGKCGNDGDCASACCSFTRGTCAAPAVAKESGGCGFGNATPNNNAFDASRPKRSLERRSNRA